MRSTGTKLPPAAAMRRWMDLFEDWIATRNGMLDPGPAGPPDGRHPDNRVAHERERLSLDHTAE
jgi:hypothetical protein